MYKKEKPRPIDGPGSNGLRGGKKAYSRNVLTGTCQFLIFIFTGAC